jgi:excisionase family DNA binding protein
MLNAPVDLNIYPHILSVNWNQGGARMIQKTNITQTRLAWSVSEVASTTGLSSGFVRKEIRAGKLRARRAGRRLLVLDTDLRQYLESEEEGNAKTGS